LACVRRDVLRAACPAYRGHFPLRGRAASRHGFAWRRAAEPPRWFRASQLALSYSAALFQCQCRPPARV